MATKFYSKTNVNNIINMACNFLDNDIIPKKYDVMVGFSKPARFK